MPTISDRSLAATAELDLNTINSQMPPASMPTENFKMPFSCLDWISALLSGPLMSSITNSQCAQNAAAKIRMCT